MLGGKAGDIGDDKASGRGGKRNGGTPNPSSVRPPASGAGARAVASGWPGEERLNKGISDHVMSDSAAYHVKADATTPYWSLL